MSTRTDSYVGSNGQVLTSGSRGGYKLNGSGKVHVVAASSEFNLTGSTGPNHSFIITGTPNAATVLTAQDGTTINSNQLGAAADIKANVYEFPLTKVVTHADNTVVLIWK